jgi:hypothetical protein
VGLESELARRKHEIEVDRILGACENDFVIEYGVANGTPWPVVFACHSCRVLIPLDSGDHLLGPTIILHWVVVIEGAPPGGVREIADPIQGPSCWMSIQIDEI